MKELVLIKLGGSVITDKSKPFTARHKVLAKLAVSVKRRFIKKGIDLILGHGGGSFPHVPAAKYQTHKGLINSKSIKGFAETADAAIQINRIVIKELLSKGINAASFAPLSFIYPPKVTLEPIKKALEIGIVPVVYGDLVMGGKNEFGIFSGEKTLDLLALKLAKNYKKIRVVYYTDTFGVYDDTGKTIPLITPKNFTQIKKYLLGSSNTDVTGGMVHKVEESLALVKKIDAEIYIVNGLDRGRFTKISKHIGINGDNFKP